MTRNNKLMIMGTINTLLALVIVFFLVIISSGCLSFGGGPNQPMLERGQQICEDTKGEWVDNTCVYPAWQMVDTTSSVLGTSA